MIYRNRQTILIATIAAAVVALCWFSVSLAARERSSRWDSVRREYLEQHPRCEACGGKVELNVHHIVPVHLCPDRELDPTNLITLCRWHHLPLGHLGDYRAFNPLVREDAARNLLRVKMRPYTIEDGRKFEQAFSTAN